MSTHGAQVTVFRTVLMFVWATLCSVVNGQVSAAQLSADPAPAASQSAPSSAVGAPAQPVRSFKHPVGRVWAVHSVTSGVGPRGLNPVWDKTGVGAGDWRSEFGAVVSSCIEPFAGGAGGFDEVMIYRPWGIEDHDDRAMHFDALPRARGRLAQLEPPGKGVSGSTARPGVTAIKRLVNTEAFVEAARRAQDAFGKPFWYYMGGCFDPRLKTKSLAELDAWVFDAAEPIIVLGGSIAIDSAGIADVNSVEWLVAQSLRRMGVKGIGYEPVAHTVQSTNNAALTGGSTQFTPWAIDPAMVGICTDALWKNRLEWRLPVGLSREDVARNARSYAVPLEQTAGEVVLWPIQLAPDRAGLDWLVDRLAEGYSVVVGPSDLTDRHVTPTRLKALAAAKREEWKGGGASPQSPAGSPAAK
jgi:hypothetical protein